MMIASLPYRAARHLFSRWCARSPSSGSHPDPHSTWRTTAGAAHQPGAGPSPGRGRPGPHPPGDDPHPDRGRLQPDLRRRPERPLPSLVTHTGPDRYRLIGQSVDGTSEPVPP